MRLCFVGGGDNNVDVVLFTIIMDIVNDLTVGAEHNKQTHTHHQ